ncbi:MAG: hypothetical protein E6R05_06470 [Candidatus Moraniibacteriota bacterium]|nr:MAG: hypothetical protein E6R05_06470 [Candidatus Moranbacteria bacterium]
MKRVVLIILGVMLSSLITYLALPPQIPHSPLGSTNHSNNQLASDQEYLILGFAPYWNMKKLSQESLDTITHFAFFALHLRGSGDIYTKVNAREEDPGYTNYKRLLTGSSYQNLILTYMQEDEDALIAMLNSPTARKVAINNIIQTMSDAKAVGMNIDLEPIGSISETLRNNFTNFITELKHATCPQPSPSCPLISISIYPSAAAKERLWDLKNLDSLTDYFVVMTYDYTMPKSLRSGPNSPLRDFSGEFEHSIIKNLSELTKLIPANKILLGIPLYGYEWNTIDSSKYSSTTSRGVTASLERIETMLNEQILELVWDRNSLTPYGISTESGTHSQIYFENEVSIRLKLDLVRSSGLGGIALWALGYDNNVPWLWPTIKTLN